MGTFDFVREIDYRGLAIGATGGALVAGVLAGTLAGVVDDALAVSIGVAVAMPIWTVLGFGAQGLDVGAYHAARGRSGLAVDALLTITGALLLGVGTVLVARGALTETGIVVGLGAGATWLGGGLAYVWRTREYWGRAWRAGEDVDAT